MKPSDTLVKPEIIDSSFREKEEGIENHKRIADYLLSAAASHFKAVSYLQDGNHEKAAQFAMLAKDSLNLANEAARESMESDFKFKL
jgi:hypothetical protein